MRANRKISMMGFLLVCAVQALAVTYYVAPGGDDNADGTNWSTAFATISNAVLKAHVDTVDTVIVSNGEYTLSAAINISAGITVRGLNGTNVTFINGGGIGASAGGAGSSGLISNCTATAPNNCLCC